MDLMHHHTSAAQHVTQEVSLNVEGMTCNNCAMTVTRFLEKRGMKNVFVDAATGAVKFVRNGNYDPKEISKGIEALGYHVAHAEEKKHSESYFLSTLESKFFFCLAFTIPLLLHMILPFQFLHDAIVQMILCIPVYAVGVWYFGRSSWGSLK